MSARAVNTTPFIGDGTTMKAETLRDLSVEELLARVEELRRSIFNLRVSATTKELKDYSRIIQQRQDLARVKTVLREKGIKV